MKRFRFDLEKILELRQYAEQDAKNELGKAVGILVGIENNIKLNAIKHSQAAQERFSGISASQSGNAPYSGNTNGGSGILSMLAWDNYILRLEQEAERLAEEAAKAEQVVDEKRTLYLEASRELKVIEKLKEKKKIEYRKEMFAAETRERDDAFRSKASI